VTSEPSYRVSRTEGPYKGLDRYDEEDWQLFFGRRRERDVIVTNLRARRVTVLYGASGVGKSSLLRAGVVHHLRDLARRNVDEIGVPEYVPVIVSSWYEDPVGTILRSLNDAVREFAPRSPLPDGPLGETIAQLSATVESRVLIVLDQLEEYFLYHGDSPGSDLLTPELAKALGRPQLGASFLLSLREDALSKLDPLRRRVPGLFDSVLRLEPLDQVNARAAIVEPLATYRGLGPRGTEPGLVEELLDQLAGGAPLSDQAGRGQIRRDGAVLGRDRIDPSYLQIVLSRLWEREEDEQQLRLVTLEDLGGAESIARSHLDDALDALPAEERGVAAEALRFLVTPLGAKIALAAEELRSFTGQEVEPTLERLAGSARVLRTVSSPLRDAPPRYEIFHDVLGPAVLDWRARYVRERERAELERETETARRAERAERRRARVFRTLATVALIGLVVALAALAYAWDQKRNADRQARFAISRADAAQVPELLDTHLDQGVARAVAARRRAPTFEARNAVLLAVERTNDLIRFLRLGQPVATASAGPGDTFLAALDGGALVVLDRNGRRVGGWKGEQATIDALAADPRRPLIAAGMQQTVLVLGVERQGGRIVLVQRGVGQLERELTVRSVAFSPDGRWLATGGRGGLTLWRLDDAGRPHLHAQLAAPDVSGLTFGRVAPLVVAATPAGLLTWDLRHLSGLSNQRGEALAGRRFVRAPVGHIGRPTAVALDARGDKLAAGDMAGRVALWRQANGWRFVRIYRGQGDKIVSLIFDRSGRRLAAASRDGTVAVWHIARASDFGSRVVDAAAVGEGRIAVLTSTGSVELHTLDGRLRERSVRRGATLVAASPDGAQLAVAGPQGVSIGLGATHALARNLVQDVAIANDGTVIAVAPDNPAVVRWDSGHRPARTLQPPEALPFSTVVSVAIAPDGSAVAAGYFDGAVVVWHGMGHVVLREHGRPVTALSFGEDSLIAAGDDRGSIELWRGLRRGSSRHLVGHTKRIRSIAFAPGGRMLASGGDDGLVRLWDVESGRVLGNPLLAGGRPVTAVGFSPDGRTLLAAHGAISVWDSTLWSDSTFRQVRQRFCTLFDDGSCP
jgi:WD40 repeat protein